MADLAGKAILLVRSLRMYQWTKNLLVLAALVFSEGLLEAGHVLTSLTACFAFCCAASATYLFNDLRDIEKDRAHPEKRHRPIASGALPQRVAWAMALALLAVSVALGWRINAAFLAALLGYLALTVSYSIILKQVVIIDVMVVAIGFVFRAMAGAFALEVHLSNWLVVCTLFLALFLGLCKRRNELVLLNDDAGKHRRVHDDYSVAFLDQMILMMACGALITYTIYTCAADVIVRFGTDKLYYTIPFVVYGLSRYLFLLHRRSGGGDPSATLLRDFPLGLTVLFWGLTCIWIIYV